MILTLQKIGDGSEEFPFQPDITGITFTSWVIIAERETEYDVEVFTEPKKAAKKSPKKATS